MTARRTPRPKGRRLALLVGILLFAAASGVSAADPHRDVTGTTVILHGLQLSATVPDWTFYMAEAIRLRAGGGRIFEYDAATGGLVDCAHPACGPQGSSGETVIVFGWAADSVESGTGFSEAAAEALVAGLVRWGRGEPPLASLDALHLIGHSRGAVVASETAERLIAAGLPAPEHMTTLDPHDAGAFGLTEERSEPEGLWDDLDVNDLHPDYECALPLGQPSGICSWDGVAYHDNYWRDRDGFPCFFDPDGKIVPGGSDFDASGLDAFCHSDVHAWYHFTIDTAAAVHPETGNPPGNDWFDPATTTCSTTARTSPLARTSDGYNFSRIGGSSTRCPDDPASKQQVLFDFNLAEGLVNGDFEKEPSGGSLAGWRFHGGGGTGQLADDGDPYLRLAAGQSMIHNQSLIPRDAIGVRFCRRVFVSGTGDLLRLTLHQGSGSRILHQEEPASSSDWRCFHLALETGERDQPSSLEITVLDDGFAPTAEIGIDDLSFRVGIFFDDFESGDSSSWSSQSP